LESEKGKKNRVPGESVLGPRIHEFLGKNYRKLQTKRKEKIDLPSTWHLNHFVSRLELVKKKENRILNRVLGYKVQ